MLPTNSLSFMLARCDLFFLFLSMVSGSVSYRCYEKVQDLFARVLPREEKKIELLCWGETHSFVC